MLTTVGAVGNVQHLEQKKTCDDICGNTTIPSSDDICGKHGWGGCEKYSSDVCSFGSANKARCY